MANIKSAQSTLVEMRDGQCLEEMAQAIHDAIAAVKLHGGKAVVSLDITIKPLKTGHNKLVEPPLIFTGTVTAKLPTPPEEDTIFYVDDNGDPTREMTRVQRGLDLTVARIDKSTGEISNEQR